jgi:hypothetical protein
MAAGAARRQAPLSVCAVHTGLEVELFTAQTRNLHVPLAMLETSINSGNSGGRVLLRVIEHRDEASPDEHVAEFRVYPSPEDPQRVLGYLMSYVASPVGESARMRTGFEFGEPVGEAFLIVMTLCEKHALKVVWVNDPNGLFPPNERPVRDVRTP